MAGDETVRARLAAAAVTRYLQRDLGFYLGYAYLPEQKPEGGVIRIAVLASGGGTNLQALLDAGLPLEAMP